MEQMSWHYENVNENFKKPFERLLPMLIPRRKIVAVSFYLKVQS